MKTFSRRLLLDGVGGENRVKLGWLIGIRWVALFGLTLSAGAGYYLGFLAEPLVPYYFLILTSLVLWNFVTTRFIHGRKHEITSADLVIQIFMDIGTLTLLLAITGGIYNPLSSFLLVHAVLAALLLRGAALYVVLALICSSLGYLQWNPDVSHLDLRGTVTRPVIFLSYALIALILSALTGGMSRALAGLRESVVSLKKRQERLDRLRLAGAMAAGFSHEFSTPLYTLKLRLDRIRRANESDGSVNSAALRADVQAASEALEHCERILRSLTDNGLKARHLSLEVVPVAKTITTWVEEYRARGGKNVIILNTRVNPETMLEMPAQPLRHSFFDLIDNACEAAEGVGEVEIDLREQWSESGLEIQLSVLNEGPEFAPVVFEKWGEPFVTTKENGTGLGVFNALTLVQAMGGSLNVVREPKRRTRVRMSFVGQRAQSMEEE